MSRPLVYFDLETQRTANDVGGWDRKADMRMSVGVTYNTATHEYRIYSERKVDDLIQELLQADLVIGYNIYNFDYEVLHGYTIIDLKHQLRTLDLMADVEIKIGHRLKLEALANASLGIGKTADGIDAIKWWREKRIMDIAEYCCYDVKITRLVHEFGAKNKELFYHDRFQQKQRVEVAWTLPQHAEPALAIH